MDHVHYDLAQVEAQIREMRAREIPSRLAAADPPTRELYLLQERFFEARLGVQLQMLQLLNEGCTPSRVGNVVGTCLANIALNTLSASPDPMSCWAEMVRVIMSAIPALAGEPDPASGVHVSAVEVHGTRGGRA